MELVGAWEMGSGEGGLQGVFWNFWEMRLRREPFWLGAESLHAGLEVKWWTERLSSSGEDGESGISLSPKVMTTSSALGVDAVAFELKGANEDAEGGAAM